MNVAGTLLLGLCLGVIIDAGLQWLIAKRRLTFYRNTQVSASKPMTHIPLAGELEIQCLIEPGVMTLHFPKDTLHWMANQQVLEFHFQISPKMHHLLTPPISN